MTKLDDYQSAMLAAYPEVPDAELGRALNAGGPRFVSFIIDHGLGPLIAARPDAVVEVAVSGEMPDVDTPDDLVRLRSD